MGGIIHFICHTFLGCLRRWLITAPTIRKFGLSSYLLQNPNTIAKIICLLEYEKETKWYSSTKTIILTLLYPPTEYLQEVQ